MQKQSKTRAVKATTHEFNARELWLASLGAASLTRKQGIKLYGTLLNEGRALQSRVSEAVANVGQQVNGTIDTVRDRIDAVVSPVRARAEATYTTVKGEVETRLSPVLARFGMKLPTAAKPAKRVAKKPVKRTRSKKAA